MDTLNSFSVTSLVDGSLTREERTATIADLFLSTGVISRISPISHLEKDLFGAHTVQVVGSVKVDILAGAVQAASEVWSLSPEAHKASVRLANQAIDQALRLIRSDISTDNSSLSAIIIRALPLIAG